jgi:hypothetical protein
MVIYIRNIAYMFPLQLGRKYSTPFIRLPSLVTLDAFVPRQLLNAISGGRAFPPL